MSASFPTPAHVVRAEYLRPGFSKIFFEETGRPCHYFTVADGPLFHSHPHPMISHVLPCGEGYEEEVLVLLPGGGYQLQTYLRLPGTSHDIAADTIHRVSRLLGAHCFTHIEPGPPAGPWGLYELRPDGTAWRRDGADSSAPWLLHHPAAPVPALAHPAGRPDTPPA